MGNFQKESKLIEDLKSITQQLKKLLSDQLRSFIQMLKSIGLGLLRMLLNLAQILLFIFYMLVLILPQLIIYLIGIIILWPIAKLEEYAFVVLDKIATSLREAISSLKDLTQSTLKTIEKINDELREISFSPDDKQE